MEVVRHQNVGVKVKRITLSHHRQTVEKGFVVAVLKKYLAPVVASGHHVIEQSLCMDSGMPGHKALISKLVDLGKSDTINHLIEKFGSLRQSSVQSSGGCVRVDFCSEDILWRFPCCLLPWSVQVTWQLVRKHVLPYTEVVNATDADMLQQTLKN